MLRALVAGTVLRPVTTLVVTLAVMLFGFVAAGRLPVELLPDLSYPTITIRTSQPDAAPLEVEDLVTRPLEELVGAVPGVVRVESVSREGESEIVLDFAWGTSMDRAMADVREKLDRANLPTDAQRPIVLRYDPTQEPILRLALVGPPGADAATLRTHADRRIKRELEKLSGVAAVQLHGGDEDEVLVELDPDRLAALGLTADDVVQAISRSNVNRPGGALTDSQSRYLVRTLHEARDASQLSAVVVRSEAGADVYVRDVARVTRRPKEREEVVLLDGHEGVELAVYREGDANIVAVARRVLDALPRLDLPPGERIEILANQATFIESAVAEVRSNVLVGGALAVAVLLFFLRDLRATVLVALAIPTSLLATFIPLRALDVSLNLMSLGGLALGVGMLVDNAIVVLESVAQRRAEYPHEPRRATAIAGTAEVATSVVASTLTTVAVFLPISFVEGVAGQLVRDLSYAVSFGILSSMLVSLTVVPVLLGLESEPTPVGDRSPRSLLAWLVLIPALLAWPLRTLLRTAGRVGAYASAPLAGAYARLESTYPPVLRAALRRRGVVLGGALLVTAVGITLGARSGRSLLPPVDQAEFSVQVVLPQGTALAHSAEVASRLAAAIGGDTRVERTFVRVGSTTQGNNASGTTRGTHLAQVNVRLSELGRAHPSGTQSDLVALARAASPDPAAALQLAEPALFTFDPPIEVHVFADAPAESAAFAREVLPDLAALPELSEVVPDDLAGRPEVRVLFDRERLARAGVTIDAAAAAVRRSVQGDIATRLHAADRQLDVRVRLPLAHRDHAADVENIVVGLSRGVPLRVAAVADVRSDIGPAELRRIDGRRGIRVRARTSSSDLGAVAASAEDVLRQHPRPGVSAHVSGQADEMQRSLASLAFTTALSVFLVYVVMASTFESLLHPMLIMSTVPISLAGALLATSSLGLPISAMLGMGIVVLGGIVVNNAIVLVDAVNQRRGRGLGVQEALLAASASRLRPIMMTTATTVLGLLPMSLGLGDGAALRQPLSVAVVGGLVLSTVLTLVVVPCAYSLMPGRTRAVWGSAQEPSAGDAPQEAVDVGVRS
jgi:HAE1 family hydrophobic/amphiphilic exporter-1